MRAWREAATDRRETGVHPRQPRASVVPWAADLQPRRGARRRLTAFPRWRSPYLIQAPDAGALAAARPDAGIPLLTHGDITAGQAAPAEPAVQTLGW